MTAFRFNDELLLSETDQDLAKKRFPNVFFALDHAELRSDFQRVDARANKAKSRSRVIGIAALVFAIVSLLAFPLEPLIISLQEDAGYARGLFRVIAIIGATCGVLAVLLGNLGFGFGKLKREWLQQRLMTERLRQWHAQYLISRLNDIAEAADSAEKQAEFEAERSLCYGLFKRNVLDQIASEYTRLTASGPAARRIVSSSLEPSANGFWIEPRWADLAARKFDNPASPALKEIFTAYEETRLLGQVQYTNYIISSEGKFWSLPARQIYVLGNTAFALVMFAFVANFVALMSAIWPSFPIGQSILGSIAISFAILAVGIRALQEALHPHRELRRMQIYASLVGAASERFASARSPTRRVEAMCLLERAAFEEMLEFLHTNESARFVL